MGTRCLAVGALAVTVVAFPTGASASQLIDRNAKAVRLSVSGDGKALVAYRVGRSFRHVVASGAINALPPSPTRRQVAFTMKYGSGRATVRKLSRRFANGCTHYDGPALKWLVAACKAPDGSYWALQSWQRALPNYGKKPTRRQAARELRLSHWSGDLPILAINTGWAYGGRFDHLSGTFSYLGVPVYGFRTTSRGVPLDGYGRNLYVDTYNSLYGRGWRRENGFLTRRGTGAFCYGFYARGGRTGRGTAYRVTVVGPGVLPDITWEGRAPGSYEQGRERARQTAGATTVGNDQRLCAQK